MVGVWWKDRMSLPEESSHCFWFYINTTTTTIILQPFLPGWASTRRNIRPPTILIIIQSLSVSSIYYDPLHPPSSIYLLDNLFCTTSLRVLFGLPLGLEPSTSYFMHFFTQSVCSFRNTCPYHRNLFCCSINIISSMISKCVYLIKYLLVCLCNCLFWLTGIEWQQWAGIGRRRQCDGVRLELGTSRREGFSRDSVGAGPRRHPLRWMSSGVLDGSTQASLPVCLCCCWFLVVQIEQSVQCVCVYVAGQ